MVPSKMLELLQKGRFNLLTQNKKILIIGLGQIGYSNAEYMTKKGLWVEGYDINKEAEERALKNGVIQKIADNFSNYDYYIICVSTHQPENMFVPYLDGLYEVVHKILREGKHGALLGIDSTIPRGTTSRVDLMLEHNFHVVHVPHRFYIHEKQEHGVNQKRVLGACHQCCLEKAYLFYNEMLGIPLYPVSSADTAELSKIVENSYRFVEIAFVEELKILCDRNNINFEELRKAINTKWNINLLEAQKGIGGHCLPKDSQMLLELSSEVLHSSVIEAAKKIDTQYREHIGEKIQSTLVIPK